MRFGRRYLWFVPFALLLIGAAEWISGKTDTFRSAVLQGAVEGAPPAAIASSRDEPLAVTRLVPVYDLGSLAGQPVEPEAQQADPRVEDAPEAAPAENENAPPVPPLAENADGPVLTVGYEEIGFDRYLEIVESIGRFFVAVRTDDGLRLGPGITFRRGTRLLPDALTTMKHLATQHPHMVSDAQIAARLSGADLPENALQESLILLMTRPFDNLMWSVIQKEVGRYSLSPDEISAIRGAYEVDGDGAYLRLQSATVRSDGRTIKLDRRLRVAL